MGLSEAPVPMLYTAATCLGPVHIRSEVGPSTLDKIIMGPLVMAGMHMGENQNRDTFPIQTTHRIMTRGLEFGCRTNSNSPKKKGKKRRT